jgi:DNA (cytosine-5)-methyltransferase 1
LFSGAGGISVGFDLFEEGRKFRVIAGIDNDEWAVSTFYANHPNAELAFRRSMNVERLRGSHIREKLGTSIDVVVGGPPCQGFSHAGPRDPFDKRNELVWHFIRLVTELRPIFFLMENVPGLLASRKPLEDPIVEQLLARFAHHGYKSAVFQLNAVDYWVPQNRKRVFVLGNSQGADLRKPPEKCGEGLDTTIGKRNFAIVGDAFGDLPIPSFGQPLEYSGPAVTEYQRFLRRESKGVYNHIPAKHDPKFAERMAKQRPGTRLYNSWNHSWYKLDLRKPSPTVKENHRAPFVHPSEPRVVTPRECARLQSFPDAYIFKGTKTAQLIQIGNAVPPLVAMSFAEEIARLSF